MGFSKKVKEDILVASARHCCVCHRYRWVKIEVHHINPKKQNGKDTFENAIALCFDCHSDAGHYFADHPKGVKFSPEELRKHKMEWFKIVKENNITIKKRIGVSLFLDKDNSGNALNPIFICEKTKYKSSSELKAIEFEKIIPKLKTGIPQFDKVYDEMNSVDDLIKFLNRNNQKRPALMQELNPQPLIFGINMNLQRYKTINKSACVINLLLENKSALVLEDYKVYLKFENILRADTVDKAKHFLAFPSYNYNVHFDNYFEAEFIPKSSVLVQNDLVRLDTICFLTTPQTKIAFIGWRLVARDFSTEGKICIDINPNVEYDELEKFVEDPSLFVENERLCPKHEYLN